MKRLIASLAVCSVVLMPVSALALATPPADNAKAEAQTAALARLKNLANTEINRRIATLNKLTQVMTDSPHLSAADKASLQTVISTQIADLKALNAKIQTATDLTTLKADIQSIRTQFRTYALIVPKVHLVRVIDRLSDAVTKLTAYANKLQARIDTAKAAGKDTAALEATMADMKTQIATATTALTTAKSQILNVTPDQYNANKSIVAATRDTLNTGRVAVAEALKDGNQILAGLKKLKP